MVTKIFQQIYLFARLGLRSLHVPCYTASVIKALWEFSSNTLESASKNDPFGGLDDHYYLLPKETRHPTLHRSMQNRGVEPSGRAMVGIGIGSTDRLHLLPITV